MLLFFMHNQRFASLDAFILASVFFLFPVALRAHVRTEPLWE